MNWFVWTPLELAANFFTVVCIVLAGRNNIHTWWTGIIGCILYGVMFYNVQLYADATLQVFFLITGMIGWWSWSKGSYLSTTESINFASIGTMANYIIIAVSVAYMYGWLLHSYTDAYAPYLDSMVLTFSVVAQLLLMSRSIQTWPTWVLVNTLSVPLFWSRELYLTSIMYGFFWCNAVYSMFYWKKLYDKQV